ncbi:MAG: cytoplasmic NAD-dependent formate dehydrogenase gamma subunit FdsG [Roseibaca calidilacus]|uniref:Formate dehydrogenase gamma subunit n=2 Tax=Roseibaca calidilacus TaxID=1666912 RepID=A0A0P7W628_9RHOB|nr:MAG: cytoplasmic NAD-dependent formate dehydrogenase gamma subunit FdsG [Roseibaca calidilacus]CUX79555.1 formate dehydrogenase gamma subunit [Roseibaca calidilacus]
MTPATPQSVDAEISAIIAEHLSLEGPLLPLLHGLQEVFGHVPVAAHGPICAALNISKAELHGVLSFYHDFREAPAGRHVVKICRAEACQAMGGAALAESVLAKLGLDWHGTSRNGAVTIEPVYCLGLCACAPAVMVDDRVVGRADAAKLDALLAEAGA